MKQPEEEKTTDITTMLEIEVEELEVKASADFMVMPSWGWDRILLRTLDEPERGRAPGTRSVQPTI